MALERHVVDQQVRERRQHTTTPDHPLTYPAGHRFSNSGSRSDRGIAATLARSDQFSMWQAEIIATGPRVGAVEDTPGLGRLERIERVTGQFLAVKRRRCIIPMNGGNVIAVGAVLRLDFPIRPHRVAVLLPSSTRCPAAIDRPSYR